MKLLISFFSLFVSFSPAWADETGKVGPSKGVLEADEHIGFKLRSGVEERYQVKTLTVGASPWIWPRGVILYSKGDRQVFRKRDGFWLAVDVSYERRGENVVIQSPLLKAGDQVATSGSGLLKIVELHVFSEEESGHIH